MVGIDEKEMIIGCFPFLGERPIIYDIGSNKGGFSDVMLEEFQDNALLFLYEPTEKLLSFTEVKYEYRDNVFFSNKALSSKKGNKDFFYFDNLNNELSSFHHGGNDWSHLPVKQKKVDVTTVYDEFTASKHSHIDYLKIDCEGHDVDVIEGAFPLIKDGLIKIIQIEYSEHYKRSKRTFQEVIDMLKGTGYDIFYYRNRNYHKLTHFVEDYESENFLITKFDLHNYSEGGWNTDFKNNTEHLKKSLNLVIECGAFEGGTTKYICDELLNDGGRVICIDPLDDTYIPGDTHHPYFKDQYFRFKRNTRGLPIDLIRGTSDIEFPKLKDLRADLVYVDGNHFTPWPYFDGSWAFAVTKIGGRIIFDDYNLWNDDTKESIDKFLSVFSPSLEIEISNYQVMVIKKADQFNEITYEYYK